VVKKPLEGLGKGGGVGGGGGGGGGKRGREGVVGEGRIKQAFLLDKRLRSPPYDL